MSFLNAIHPVIKAILFFAQTKVHTVVFLCQDPFNPFTPSMYNQLVRGTLKVALTEFHGTVKCTCVAVGRKL